ncbi:MAG: class I SAM-dependent methyltransferase [Bacteroidetes bacterium]|nr:class I SAM-dependent methyltransferase [Bacteroidota bacterium]
MHRMNETRSFFDAMAPKWIVDTEERTARLAEIFSHYDLPLAAPLLDIGGGAGILLPFLRNHGMPHASIIELEIAQEMLRLARQRHGEDHHITFLRGDGQRLPFRNAMFGSVHCFSVYPHFHDPKSALAEIRRCLSPEGGLCILHLMGHEQLNALHREAGRVVAHDVLPPIDRLAQTVREAGYAVTHAEERDDLYLLTANKTE